MPAIYGADWKALQAALIQAESFYEFSHEDMSYGVTR